MSETHDTDETDGEDGDLDLRQAATLLEQTMTRTQRQFDISPPLLMLTGVPVVLVAYGAVWLLVRAQHPYSGPSGTALAVLYSTLIVWVTLVAVVFQRATTGVGGRSARQQKVDGAAFATIWAPSMCSRARSTTPVRATRSSTGFTRRQRRSSSSAGRRRPTRRHGELAPARFRTRRGRPRRHRRLRRTCRCLGRSRYRPLHAAHRPRRRSGLAALDMTVRA